MANDMVCLLVDDDSDDRDIFSIALREARKDVRLIEATGCEEALQLVKEDGLSPHYIFLDLNMPRMSGTECLIELRKIMRLRGVPIIIYSTSSADRDRYAAEAAGAHRYFTKPSSIQILTRTLKDIITA